MGIRADENHEKDTFRAKQNIIPKYPFKEHGIDKFPALYAFSTKVVSVHQITINGEPARLLFLLFNAGKKMVGAKGGKSSSPLRKNKAIHETSNKDGSAKTHMIQGGTLEKT